jgi:hypothetical protein
MVIKKSTTITEIFPEWKIHKFVMINTMDSGSQLYNTDASYSHMVILVDYVYWIENLDKLEEWCKSHNCVQRGMTVQIPNEETATIFMLRWS